MPRLTITAVVARDLADAESSAFQVADSAAEEMRLVGRSASRIAEDALVAALDALALAGAQAAQLDPDHPRTAQLREAYRAMEAARRIIATR